MAIPPTATALSQPLDPADIDDYLLTVTKAGIDTTAFPMLEANEGIASFTLALAADAIAVGLTIRTSGEYPPPTLNGLDVKFWLSVDASLQGATIFDAAGITVAMELTIITTSTPPRKRQKTATVRIANQ